MAKKKKAVRRGKSAELRFLEDLDLVGADYNNPQALLAWMIRYGYHHLFGITAEEAAKIDPASKLWRGMIAYAQTFWARGTGTEADGKIGPVGAAVMASPRCGCPDVEDPARANAGLVKIDEDCQRAIKVRAAFDGVKGISVELAESEWYRGFDVTAQVCNIGTIKVDSTNEAHVWAKMGRTGRGVLAYQWYPTGCGNFPKNGGVCDQSRDWGRAYWFATNLHETGHALGLSHGELYNDVMGFKITEAWDDWQANDKKRLIRRYGPAMTDPVDPPPIPGPTRIVIRGTQVVEDSSGSALGRFISVHEPEV